MYNEFSEKQTAGVGNFRPPTIVRGFKLIRPNKSGIPFGGAMIVNINPFRYRHSPPPPKISA